MNFCCDMKSQCKKKPTSFWNLFYGNDVILKANKNFKKDGIKMWFGPWVYVREHTPIPKNYGIQFFNVFQGTLQPDPGHIYSEVNPAKVLQGLSVSKCPG